MKKPFIVANVREVLDLYDKEEISFSRMVEILNEIAEKFYEKSIVKDCETCEYSSIDLDDEPCTSCNWYDFNFSKWEPKS